MTAEPRGDSAKQDRFAPLTPGVRLALEDAMVEAHSRGFAYIMPEHMLLGLIGSKSWAAWLILSGLGIGDALATAKMETRQYSAVLAPRPLARARDAVFNQVPTRLARQSRTVLALAGEEAAMMDSDTIDTAHLLIGILREGSVDNTVFGRLINSAMLDEVRNLATQTRGQGQEQWISTRNPNALSSPPPRVRILEVPVDVSTLDVLDLLVEAGIKPTRADVLNWFIGTGMSQCRRTILYAQIMAKELRTLRETFQLAVPRRRSQDVEPPIVLPASDAPQGLDEPGSGPEVSETPV